MFFVEILLASVATAALRCDHNDLPAETAAQFSPVHITGSFERSFERIAFCECGTKGSPYWVNSTELQDIWNQNYEKIIESDSWFFVELKALKSPAGRYGHRGRYKYCLTEIKIVSFKLVPTGTGNQPQCRHQ